METQQLIAFKKVQKKPVQVEACQLSQEIWCEIFNSENGVIRIGEYTLGALISNNEQYFLIETLEDAEGKMHRAKINDWLIKGVQNEIYPCKPDIFTATYDYVETERSNALGNMMHSPILLGVDLASGIESLSQDASKAGEYHINGERVTL